VRFPLPTSVRSGLRNEQGVAIGAAVAALVVAVLLYTRFSVHGDFVRDEGIYAYGGQRLADDGVAPYASIFDPKTPLATILCAFGAAIGRLLGRSELTMIRVVFFLCSVLTVLAVYLLAARLFRSVLGALVASVVFASFFYFASDALTGPDAKTPGVLFSVLAMWFAARRQWFWSGVLGGLALLVWQPLILYVLVAVVVAVFVGPRDEGESSTEGRHWRSGAAVLLGAVIPVAVTSIYFALAGAFGDFIESALVFPLTGVQRAPETFHHHVKLILNIISREYHFSGGLLEAGLICLVLLAGWAFVSRRGNVRGALADPLVSIVFVTAVLQVLYALYDFQGGPDVFPLLPYGALGIGGVAGLAATKLAGSAARVAAIAAFCAAALALTVYSWQVFSDDRLGHRGLRDLLANACGIERIATPQAGLLSLGDPMPLVLTHSVNPDRYIFLGSGVDKWKVQHTTGGFAGWTSQIQAEHPGIVVLQSWTSPDQYAKRMAQWLAQAGYHPSYLGRWRVYLSPDARLRARGHGVRLTRAPTKFATGLRGRRLPAGSCH
jgi:hypothetical protein